MAKTLNDFTPSDAAALNDNCVVYLVDPAKGNAGDLVVTLGTLKSFLGTTGAPPPPPAPPGTVETPTFAPVEGTYTAVTSVAISCSTPGASIFYTLNGSTPTTSSTPYTGAISISNTTTVKAIAIKSGMNNSAVATATYTINIGSSGGSGSNPTGFLNIYGTDVAEYPRTYITSRMPVRTGALITVAAGGDLQAALNSAQPGDWIVLEAGATWTGNYTLPLKNGDVLSGGNNVIVVTTSAFASLPEKVRVTNATNNAFFANLKNLSTANEDGLKTAQGTAGWRLVGLNVTADVTVSTLSRLLYIGDGSITQNSTNIPKNIIVDRCRFDGHSTLNLRRAIHLDGNHCAVINCWFGDEIHFDGSDCQAIVSYNSGGPYKIVNNRLQGSTEVLLFGGSTNTYGTGSDIEIRYNTLSHPTAWRGVALWDVKNLFELKRARRVLFQYNYLHDVWPDGQSGFAILIKHEPYGDEAGGQTEDIIIRDNKIDNAAGGIDIATVADNNGGSTTLFCRRVINYNNLYINISNSANSSGVAYIYQLANTNNCWHAHCTMVGDGSANTTVYPDAGISNVHFRDMIFGGSTYGIKGPGQPEGNVSISTCDPGGTLSKCILTGRGSGSYPTDCFFPAALANIGFTNMAGGDYSLSSSSLFKNQGTGGTDPGCDITAMLAGVNLAISGDTTTVQT